MSGKLKVMRSDLKLRNYAIKLTLQALRHLSSPWWHLSLVTPVGMCFVKLF